MRQGQQNRRGRGRNNNNRKGQNPLSRSFESNGPDVKIRGTPAHIAEKYISLARDAQTSGDPVLAENYTQHAEHYNRIIMAYRDQMQQPGDIANGNGHRVNAGPGEGGDDFRDDDNEDILDEGYQQSQLPSPQVPQPPRPPYEGNRHENRHQGNRNDGPRHDRPFRRDQNQNRHRDRYNDRDRGGDRDRLGEPRPPQQMGERQDSGGEGGDPRRRDRDRLPQQQHEQPEFLRRPVRRARSESDEATPPAKDEPSND